MSNHKTPLAELEREGLIKHGLDKHIGKPSQLADTFRAGVAWALGQNQAPMPSTWLPISTAPRDEDARILCLADDSYVDICRWTICAVHGDRFTSSDDRTFGGGGKYTHWMALPTVTPLDLKICSYCDGTGDVHDQIGNWRGICDCEAGAELRGKAVHGS